MPLRELLPSSKSGRTVNQKIAQQFTFTLGKSQQESSLAARHKISSPTSKQDRTKSKRLAQLAFGSNDEHTIKLVAASTYGALTNSDPRLLAAAAKQVQ